ncbi:MAG: hypothetical protein GY841_17615 [FCB group bacterium]|nr:hypothetical protein [FCB group bacterium]
MYEMYAGGNFLGRANNSKKLRTLVHGIKAANIVSLYYKGSVSPVYTGGAGVLLGIVNSTRINGLSIPDALKKWKQL